MKSAIRMPIATPLASGLRPGGTAAALYDDGHGMSRNEFVTKWLVVGMESKVSTVTPIEDRNGLPYRSKQGKKGIGRLSAGYLGNLLLVISKRQDEDFVAALLDWRVFENPFLLLDDIRVPLTTFRQKEQLLSELPRLYDTLMANVWGERSDEMRMHRIRQAWESYDKLESSAVVSGFSTLTTRARIEQTLTTEAFTARHLAQWAVWSGDTDHGTALLIGGVTPDIEAQLRPDSYSATDKTARENLRSTLWSFVDPFRELVHESHESSVENFSTSIIGRREEQRLPIIGQDTGFEAQSASQLEHAIDGRVDESGTFQGRVEASPGGGLERNDPGFSPSTKQDALVAKRFLLKALCGANHPVSRVIILWPFAFRQL